MDDLVKAVDRAENSRKENGMKVGQAGGDAAARWLESRKLRGVKLVFIHLSSNSYFCFRGVNSETTMDAARAAFGFLVKCYNKAKLEDAHKE